MSATPGIRIVTNPVWWTEKMGLTQDLFQSAELVQIKNHFWDPNTQPAEQEYYKKYQATLTDGRQIVLPNRVSDISGLKWDIQPLMDWQSREQNNKILGVPVLKGVVKGTGEVVTVKSDWKKIDAAIKECSEYSLELDTTKALVQPYEEYLEPALRMRHRQAFFDRSSTRDEAAELGTRAHDLIDKWLTNPELQDYDEERDCLLFDRVIYRDRDGNEWVIDLQKEDPRVQGACAAFYKFWDQTGLQMVASEFLVCDLKNGTAGMIDNVSRFENNNDTHELAIIDYKTGNYIGQSMLLQTAGYAHMFELMTGQRIDKVWIIQLDKETAEFNKIAVFETQKERQEQIDAWNHAMWLYHWQKRQGKTTLAKSKDPKKGKKAS